MQYLRGGVGWDGVGVRKVVEPATLKTENIVKCHLVSSIIRLKEG
jgi:hypothetical protein